MGSFVKALKNKSFVVLGFQWTISLRSPHFFLDNGIQSSYRLNR
jgi:hypothetical protein